MEKKLTKFEKKENIKNSENKFNKLNIKQKEKEKNLEEFEFIKKEIDNFFIHNLKDNNNYNKFLSSVTKLKLIFATCTTIPKKKLSNKPSKISNKNPFKSHQKKKNIKIHL